MAGKYAMKSAKYTSIIFNLLFIGIGSAFWQFSKNCTKLNKCDVIKQNELKLTNTDFKM